MIEISREEGKTLQAEAVENLLRYLLTWLTTRKLKDTTNKAKTMTKHITEPSNVGAKLIQPAEP